MDAKSGKDPPGNCPGVNMQTLIQHWERGSDRICRDAPQLVFAHASKEFGSAVADCHTALA